MQCEETSFEPWHDVNRSCACDVLRQGLAMLLFGGTRPHAFTEPLLAVDASACDGIDAYSLSAPAAQVTTRPITCTGSTSSTGEGRVRGRDTLQSEAKLLRWESQRIAREIRGMRALLRALGGEVSRGEAQREGMSQRGAASLPSETLAAPLEDLDAEGLLAEITALREAIQQQADKLRGLQALLAKRRPDLDSCREKEEDVYIKGVVHGMPPDGSCLFHSLAFGLPGASPEGLRQEIADFIEASPGEVVAGQPIKEWVLWESGDNPGGYARRMRAGGEWGGAIEMAVCSHMRRVDIHVYERAADQFHRICAFDVQGGGSVGVVRLAFRPGHYDALVVGS